MKVISNKVNFFSQYVLAIFEALVSKNTHGSETYIGQIMQLFRIYKVRAVR